MKKGKPNMINVRLDDKTNQELTDHSQQTDSTKSLIVNEALAMYFNKEQAKQSPYALGKDLFGAAASGRSDTSTTYKAKLKSKLNAKHAH